MRYSCVFLLSFLIIFLIQTFIWQSTGFTDQEIWLTRISQLCEDLASGNVDAENPVYSGHPGMPAVFLASLAYCAGSPLEASLRSSVSAINALAIASIAVIGLSSQFSGPWVIAGSLIIAFHPLYAFTSPTSAVAAPYTLLLVMITLAIYSSSPRDYKVHLVILWGVVAGLLFTTRFVTAAIIFPFLLFLFTRQLSARAVGLALSLIIISALALDPLMLSDPIQHVLRITHLSSLNVTDAILSNPFSFSEILLFAPLAVSSLLVASAFLLSPRLLLSLPLPGAYITILILMTTVFSAIFLNVKAPSVRHFMPVIFTWEFFAPLFILRYISILTHDNSTRAVVRYGVIALIVFSQLVLFIHSIP